jgi:hypothetical protein
MLRTAPSRAVPEKWKLLQNETDTAIRQRTLSIRGGRLRVRGRPLLSRGPPLLADNRRARVNRPALLTRIAVPRVNGARVLVNGCCW